jgi:hypothetical protein
VNADLSHGEAPAAPTYPPMPPHVRARVERTLDTLARELLDIELDVNSGVIPLPRPSGRVDGDDTSCVSD